MGENQEGNQGGKGKIGHTCKLHSLLFNVVVSMHVHTANINPKQH